MSDARVKIPWSVSSGKKRLAEMNRELKAMEQHLPPPRDFAVEYEYLRQYLSLMEIYGEMCDRLRECVQRHGLGLGGEHVDQLVIEALDRRILYHDPLLDLLPHKNG